MRLSIHVELDYWIEDEADVLLQVEVAAMADQTLEVQDLTLWTDSPLAAVKGEDGIGQRCLTRGVGSFRALYHAVVAINRPSVDLASLAAAPPRQLPAQVISYLLPSRYCESDRFEGFVQGEFAGLEGGALARSMCSWVRQHLRYESGTSSGVTTAMMTFADRRGVCRDYAHLLCALLRAGGLPARCVSAYAPGVDPQDFHAVCEVWLADGWHLLDPTGMASCDDIARVAVGRDATDIAFMTVFGRAVMNNQQVNVSKL